MLVLWTIGCGWLGPDPAFLDEAPAPTRPAPRTATGVGLARDGLAAAFELPPSSRPGGAPAPERTGPVEPFRKDDARKKADVYRTRLPIHDNLLPTQAHGTHSFGSKPPPGLVVTGPSGEVPFERGGKGPGTYGFDRESLLVGVPSGAAAPKASEYTLTFTKATESENALNLATSGLEPEAFARRTITVGQTSHTGLYLPAPASATFPVTVPANGHLSFEATVLPPAIASAEASDGATVRVIVRADGQEAEVGSVSARLERFAPGRFDLSRWEGREIELVLRTDPGATATFDYVLLEGAALYTPKGDPERILVVFVDTLRPDHLGFYGYERPTSPNLDRWAQHAAVFTQARSVAPWTLPSARAALSGRQPEDWYEATPLPEPLAARGWRTEALVTNAFLSQPFDVHRGWDRFHYEHLLEAEDIVDHARDVVARHADRDLLLLVHFMEPHLPYDEPRSVRGLFAGKKPDALEYVSRNELVNWGTRSEGFAEVRDYVTGRYDQNIRAVDDALLALLHDVGTDATVVLFSDHGEELWEHDGFEHGHAFWDELLKVPLAIRSPRLPAGRHDAPVSLLDVTPTLLEIAGVDVPNGPGRSLVASAWGDAGAADALVARPQAFGRPLYGDDGWGVVQAGRKWWDRDGAQQLYHLEADPDEALDLAPGEASLERYAGHMADALGREVQRAWRFELRAVDDWPFDVELNVSHPQGLKQVWKGYDPRGRNHVEPELVDGRVRLRVAAGRSVPEVLYVIPDGDALDPRGLAVTWTGRQVAIGGIVEQGPFEPTARRTEILRVADARFAAVVDLAWVPEPGGVEVSGFHPDLEQQLRDLGYVDP